MKERWVTAAGTGRLYEVSDLGRVRRFETKRVLRPRIRRGYDRAALALGVFVPRLEVSVHRLVLESFVGPAPVGAEVNHKNGTKSDNRLVNLEWVTRTENIRHAVRTGMWRSRAGEANPNAKLTQALANEIREATGTLVEVAARYGVERRTVWEIRKGRRWVDITNPRWVTA